MSNLDKPTPPQMPSGTKSEILENTTPEQIVIQLETEARALLTIQDIYDTKSAKEDLRDFSERTGQRVEVLDALLEKLPKNPALEMAKHLIEWEYLAQDLKRIGNPNYMIPSWAKDDQDILDLFGGEWSRFQSVLINAKRLNAYIQPLINESGKDALPLRAIIATVNGIATDLANTFQPHGVEIDDVKILSPAPKDAKIRRDRGEMFLSGGRGDKLPLHQMKALFSEKLNQGQQDIVTDVLDLGWSFKGERRRESVVTVYQEGAWPIYHNAPEFRTS